MEKITNDSLLIIVSAPSGGGKTTLCEKIIESNAKTVRAITCTTRPPRKGERDGIDYYFLDAADFAKRIDAGDFLEHATVHGNYYGTLKSEIFDRMREGQDVLLSIDVQGAATIRARALANPSLRRALVTVFVTPPSVTVLEERLRRRGTDAPAVIANRLKAARQEIAEWKNYDYLILSASIKEDVRRMEAILTAEKLRAFRARAPMDD